MIPMNSNKHYLDYFLDIPIGRILKEYNTIELQIIEDLVSTISNIFKNNGFTNKNNIFTKIDDHYRLVVDFLKNGRTLIISVHNIIKKNNKVTKQCDINSFGLIKNIILELPNPSPINPDKTIEILKNQTIVAYTALEQAIISNFQNLERDVFKKLYDCLEFQFKISNKKELLGRFWLFISEIDVGFYFFEKKIIEKVIEHYKKNQDETLSPLELTVWIMTAPLPYQKSLAFQAKQIGHPLSLKWKKAKYIEDAEKIFLAEVALYNSEEYTANTICESRGYFLVMACPTEMDKEIFPEVDKVKNSLERYFINGLKEWSPYLKIAKKLSQASDESGVASFIGTVLGKAVSEFLKEISSP